MKKLVLTFCCLTLAGCQVAQDDSGFCDKILADSDYYLEINRSLPAEKDEDLCVWQDEEFINSIRPVLHEHGRHNGVYVSNKGLYFSSKDFSGDYLERIESTEDMTLSDLVIYSEYVFKTAKGVYLIDLYNHKLKYLEVADADSFGYVESNNTEIFEDKNYRYFVNVFDGGRIDLKILSTKENVDWHSLRTAIKGKSELYYLGYNVGEVNRQNFVITEEVGDRLDYLKARFAVGGEDLPILLKGRDIARTYCLVVDYKHGKKDDMTLLANTCDNSSEECEYVCSIYDSEEYQPVYYEALLSKRGLNETLDDVVFIGDSRYDEKIAIIGKNDLYLGKINLGKVDTETFKSFFKSSQYFQDVNYLYCIDDMFEDRLLRKEIEKVDSCVLDQTCKLPACDTSFDKFDSIRD